MRVEFDTDVTFTDFYSFVKTNGHLFLVKYSVVKKINVAGYKIGEYYELFASAVNEGLSETTAF